MSLIVWRDWYQHKFYSWEIFSVTAWLQWLVPSADNRGWGVTVRCNSCNGSHITIFEPRSKKSKVWIVTGWKTQGHCYRPLIHFQARIHWFIIKFARRVNIQMFYRFFAAHNTGHRTQSASSVRRMVGWFWRLASLLCDIAIIAILYFSRRARAPTLQHWQNNKR